MSEGPYTLVWLDAQQAPLVRGVGRRARLSIVGAGCAEAGQTPAVAEALGAEPVGDLRAALASGRYQVVWLARAGALAATGGGEAGAVVEAIERGVRVLSADPLPASLMDLAGEPWRRAQRRPERMPTFVPLPRMAEPFASALDALADFGRVRSASVEVLAPPAAGSLGSALFAACSMLHAVLGEAESVDASYALPARAGGLHVLPGETLSGLRGDVCASLRFDGGRGATLLASDHGGEFSRRLTLLGEGGRMEVTDEALTWFTPEGRPVDRTSYAREGGDDAGVAAIAGAIERSLRGEEPPGPPVDVASLLATAQAALLSCRTGQNERPATIRRMAEG